MEQNLFKYSLVTEESHKTLNFLCSSFTGSANVKTLLANLGVKHNVTYQTNNTFWTIPETKLKYLLKYLNKYTSVQSGGAPRFYVDFEGILQCVDLKKIYESGKAIEAAATITSDVCNYDWVITYPGTVEVIAYSAEGTKTRKIELGDGFGISRINDTTGYAIENIAQRVTNEFYYRHFTSRKITLSNVAAEDFKIGTLLMFRGFKCIITSMYIYPAMGGGMPTMLINVNLPCREL